MHSKLALTLSVLLIPSLSWAGAADKLRGVISSQPITITANAINGVSSISSGGVTDTGTGNGFGTGTISVYAECDAASDGGSDVYLYVNGVEADSLSCVPGNDGSATLTASVSGAYTARVYGVVDNAYSFAAGPFTFPASP